MIGFDLEFALQLVLWPLCMLGVWVIQRRRSLPSAGWVLYLLFTMWYFYSIGAIFYIDSTYALYDPVLVKLGYQQSLFAVLAFCAGAVLIGARIKENAKPPLTLARRDAQAVIPASVVWAFFLIGLGCFVLLGLVGFRFPTLTALLGVGGNLMAFGACLGVWRAWQLGQNHWMARWLAAALIYPIIVVTGQGYLGGGFLILAQLVFFTSAFVRFRWAYVLALLALSYFALSVTVTYFRDRGAIRNVVWGGGTWEKRIEQFMTTFGNLEWFDPQNPQHRYSLDSRLNQSALVGKAVWYLQSGQAAYAYGETFWQMALALIPRALWEDKPIRLGGSVLVAAYTGDSFAPNTSVAPGLVMELFLNFGTAGVILGFMVMGAAVYWLDASSAERLAVGDWRGATLYFLPAYGFLAGWMTELAASVAAGALVAVIVTRAVSIWIQPDKTRPPSAQSSFPDALVPAFDSLDD